MSKRPELRQVADATTLNRVATEATRSEPPPIVRPERRTVLINVTVPEELAIALAERAEARGVSQKQIITRALAAAGLPVDPLDLKDRTFPAPAAGSMTGDQLGERREAVQAAANALAAVADKLDAASEPAPEPGPPSDAPAIKRVAMTFRTTESAYERLRRRASETRVSQQAIVDQALDYFLGERTAA